MCFREIVTLSCCLQEFKNLSTNNHDKNPTVCLRELFHLLVFHLRFCKASTYIKPDVLSILSPNLTRKAVSDLQLSLVMCRCGSEKEQSCELDRFLFEFKYEFSLLWQVQVRQKCQVFRVQADKNTKFILVFNFIALFLYTCCFSWSHKQMNDMPLLRKTHSQFTWLDQEKNISDNFLIHKFFLINSNSFIQVRVQKKYFFEFKVELGKNTEFF